MRYSYTKLSVFSTRRLVKGIHMTKKLDFPKVLGRKCMKKCKSYSDKSCGCVQLLPPNKCELCYILLMAQLQQ